MTLDFDPALRELLYRVTGRRAGMPIPEHVASREIPVVARLTDARVMVPGLRVVSQFGAIVTGRAPLGRIIALREHEGVESLKASLTFAPSLRDSVPHIRAHPDALWRHGKPDMTGRGTIVGAIDWGCDFAHDNFRAQDGNTRLLAIWDQRVNPSPSSPAPYGYGRVMERAEINAALKHDDPYSALGYDPSDADFDGRGTHGTHILDIAAGSGRSPGVAPGAELLFVHLRGDDTLPQETLGDSVRLLEAVRWVLDRAGWRPVVINLSLGRTGGPHDGTTLVERALDAAVQEQSGRAIVMSTGNYFSANLHSQGLLRQGQKAELRFRVPEARRGVSEMEIWYPGQDEFVAELVDPMGRAVTRVELGQQSIVTRYGTTLATVYHRRHDPNNHDHQINLFLWPEARGGTWRVRLMATRVELGAFHAWIERTTRRSQARFTPECARQESTTNTICNGHETIVVGAYDVHGAGAPMTRFSSSGPTRDGRPRPTIVAPGRGIRAARSRPRGEQSSDLVTRKSGTSMAAPHVAGTIALMFEAALPWRLTIEQTRTALLNAARPIRPTHPLDQRRAGAGSVDTAAAVAAVRRVIPPGTNNPIKEYVSMTRQDREYQAFEALSWLQECMSGDAPEESHSPTRFGPSGLHPGEASRASTCKLIPPRYHQCAKKIAKPSIISKPAHRNNYQVADRSRSHIDSIVIHTIEGSANAAINWFRNGQAKVSSHFVVSNKGAITQMVAPKDVAWTQTYYNRRAIGIECEGYANDPNTWTTALMSSLVHLTAWLCHEYSIPVFHPSGRAESKTQPFIQCGLLGHSQIQPWNKQDPGLFFDWDNFIHAVLKMCK